MISPFLRGNVITERGERASPWFIRWLEDLRLAMPPVGSVSLYVGSTAPKGWFFLDGSTFNGNKFPELKDVLGSTTLPDWSDRIPMGAGSTVALGVTGGASSVTLAVTNLPAHSHGVTDPGHTHTAAAVDTDSAEIATGTPTDGATSGNTGSAATGISIDSTGGDTPFDIIPPVVGVNWIIKT